MKNLFAKIITALVLFFVIFGIAHVSYAAFPGKHNQAKEVITIKNTESVTVDANATKATAPNDDDLVLLVILCFLLPPLAVYLKYNEAGKPFIVNIILTLLCGLPGVIHALVHVFKI
jgi:uncharacterized membrane protein YqaE (UPF0057 family)